MSTKKNTFEVWSHQSESHSDGVAEAWGGGCPGDGASRRGDGQVAASGAQMARAADARARTRARGPPRGGSARAQAAQRARQCAKPVRHVRASHAESSQQPLSPATQSPSSSRCVTPQVPRREWVRQACSALRTSGCSNSCVVATNAASVKDPVVGGWANERFAIRCSARPLLKRPFPRS